MIHLSTGRTADPDLAIPILPVPTFFRQRCFPFHVFFSFSLSPIKGRRFGVVSFCAIGFDCTYKKQPFLVAILNSNIILLLFGSIVKNSKRNGKQ